MGSTAPTCREPHSGFGIRRVPFRAGVYGIHGWVKSSQARGNAREQWDGVPSSALSVAVSRDGGHGA